MPLSNAISVIDLFCGCGGLSYGLMQAARLKGLELDVRLAIDTNEDALTVYRQNISAREECVIGQSIDSVFCPDLHANVTENEKRLLKRVSKVDFLVAGPPCQGNSDLNNRTRRNDPRNDLYLMCARAIKLVQPKVVLIENVPTVVHAKQRVVQTTNEILEELGYHVEEFDVDFSMLGVPQKRKRHILLASTNRALLEALRILETFPHRTLRDAILDLEDAAQPDGDLMSRPGRLSDENQARVRYLFCNDIYDLPDFLRPPCHRDKNHSYKSIYGRLRWDVPAQTITSGFGSMGQGRYIHPARPRTLTPREAARIQGFPDEFSFEGLDKISVVREIIANAVPPVLTRIIGQTYISKCKMAP